MRKALLIISVSTLLLNNGSVCAGTVAGTGGSTEITQVSNNVILAKSVAQSAQQTALQITTATNTINTYMTALQNLQHLPAVAIARMLAPYKDQVKEYAKLYKAVYGVYTTSKDLKDAVEQRQREMIALKKSPTEYLAAEIKFAQSQGDGAGKRIEEDMKRLGLFEKKAKELEEVQKSIPSDVTGNVQGLVVLNQQVTAMRAENMEMSATLMQQKVLAEQQFEQSSLQRKNSGELALKARQEADARALRNEKEIGPTKFNYPSLFP